MPDRQYAAAQAAFTTWCRDRLVRFPASHEQIAAYLQYCKRWRGPYAMRQHLAAIGRLYRAAGKHLDTKAPAIQQVTTSASRRQRR